MNWEWTSYYLNIFGVVLVILLFVLLFIFGLFKVYRFWNLRFRNRDVGDIRLRTFAVYNPPCYEEVSF